MENLQQDPQTEQNALSGFLPFARDKGIRISTSEWLNFLGVIEDVGQESDIAGGDFYDALKSLGSATLIKDKADIATYSDAFDEFFKNMKIAHEEELQRKVEVKEKLAQQALETTELQEKIEDTKSSETPELKEQLGVKEVKPNDLDDEHDDDETTHGGKQDQHNDVLTKQDENKDGGGNKGKNTQPGDGDQQGNSTGKSFGGETDTGKDRGRGQSEEPGKGKHFSEDGIGHSSDGTAKEKTDVGVAQHAGGKGKSVQVLSGTHLAPDSERIIHDSQVKQPELSKELRHKDWRERYNVRPDRTDIYEIVKNLRRIITDTSQVASGRLDISSTIDNFAKKELRFDYENEREIRPETVLFIDVGGPVDEWRPLMEELSKGMSRGLLKLEIHLFHNQLYGYCWDPKDGNYAKPNGLKNVRDIVKKRKKVVIYGDADMAESEIEYDNYPPDDNEEKIQRYEMKGLDCLRYIKQNSENVVWINPMFKSSWYYDSYYDEYDTDNSVGQISDIIPMYDLSIGGVQDAIADLMER